jgi:hypothetical protein
VWWFTFIIPATKVMKVGESWFQAILGKASMIPYLKNKLKAKRIEI